MAGLKENFPDGHLTYDELIEKVNALPGNSYLGSYNTKEDVLAAFCLTNLNSWVDYEKGECYFDDPSFTQMLEFVDSIELAPSIDWDEINKQKDNGNITSDEYHGIMLENSMRVKNGSALVFNDYFNSPGSVGDMKDIYGVSPEEVTYIYPLNGGNGLIYPGTSYSILSSGSCTEGAWDFMNFIMSDDLLTNYLQTESYFVTREESFYKIFDKIREITLNPEVKNEDGTTTHYGYVSEPITDENIKAVTDYISQCTALQGYSPEVWDIIIEEYQAYDAGEITAEECAERIQDRVGIYLSEQY